MNSNLARVLLSRGVIRQGTVIQANQKVRGLSCECNETVLHSFVIVAARLQNGSDVVFDTFGPDQVATRVRSEHVIKLDGMRIDRIAIAQHLALDGQELAQRSRRGRRTKTELLQAQAA